MSSVNKAIVLGNLTRDPENKRLDSGTEVTTFSVATNRTWKDKNGEKQEDVEFHNIVAWGKLAEICAKYLNKGKKVYIEGRLQTRNWEDDAGVKKYRTEIVAQEMVMLSGGNRDKQEGGYPEQDQYAAPKTRETEDDIKVEDIPF